MRYTIEGGRVKKSRRWPLFLAAIFFMTGGYLLYNVLAPAIPDFTVDKEATAQKLKTVEPAPGDNRIYMPQINVDVPIVDINGNEEAALDKGAIHRAPGSGNPRDGGNYVVAAHRFTLGVTPAQTRLKSPFYHMNQMAIDDMVYVDYEGERYAYKIYEKKTVSPSSIEIEDRTDEPRLTIYTCTLSGSNDGREVLFAKMVGKVSWNSGQPGLKADVY